MNDNSNCNLHTKVNDFLREIPAYTGAKLLMFTFRDEAMKTTTFSLFGPILSNLT